MASLNLSRLFQLERVSPDNFIDLRIRNYKHVKKIYMPVSLLITSTIRIQTLKRTCLLKTLRKLNINTSFLIPLSRNFDKPYGRLFRASCQTLTDIESDYPISYSSKIKLKRVSICRLTRRTIVDLDFYKLRNLSTLLFDFKTFHPSKIKQTELEEIVRSYSKVSKPKTLIMKGDVSEIAPLLERIIKMRNRKGFPSLLLHIKCAEWNIGFAESVNTLAEKIEALSMHPLPTMAHETLNCLSRMTNLRHLALEFTLTEWKKSQFYGFTSLEMMDRIQTFKVHLIINIHNPPAEREIFTYLGFPKNSREIRISMTQRSFTFQEGYEDYHHENYTILFDKISTLQSVETLAIEFLSQHWGYHSVLTSCFSNFTRKLPTLLSQVKVSIECYFLGGDVSIKLLDILQKLSVLDKLRALHLRYNEFREEPGLLIPNIQFQNLEKLNLDIRISGFKNLDVIIRALNPATLRSIVINNLYYLSLTNEQLSRISSKLVNCANLETFYIDNLSHVHDQGEKLDLQELISVITMLEKIKSFTFDMKLGTDVDENSLRRLKKIALSKKRLRYFNITLIRGTFPIRKVRIIKTDGSTNIQDEINFQNSPDYI